MAINVSYDIGAPGANAAYLAGLGQYDREEQERLFRQQQADRQFALQQAQLQDARRARAAQMQSQQSAQQAAFDLEERRAAREQQQAAADRQLKRQITAATFEEEYLQEQRKRQQEQEDYARRLADERETLAYKAALEQEQWAGLNRLREREQAGSEDNRRRRDLRSALNDLWDRIDPLLANDPQARSSALTKYRQATAMISNPNMLPENMAEPLYDLMEDMSNDAERVRNNAPQSFEEQVAEDVVELPNGMIAVRDRSGSPRLEEGPALVERREEQKRLADMQKVAIDVAKDTLMAAYEAQVNDFNQRLIEYNESRLSADVGKTGKPPVPPAAPTAQQIAAEARTIMQLMSQDQTQPQAQQGSVQDQTQPPPSQEPEQHAEVNVPVLEGHGFTKDPLVNPTDGYVQNTRQGTFVAYNNEYYPLLPDGYIQVGSQRIKVVRPTDTLRSMFGLQ